MAIPKNFYMIAAQHGSEETERKLLKQKGNQVKVTKTVLCCITGNPVAIVNVDEATLTISVAGAYTTDGRPVNVVVMKVSSDKRKIARFNSIFPDVGESSYNAKTDTFSLL